MPSSPSSSSSYSSASPSPVAKRRRVIKGKGKKAAGKKKKAKGTRKPTHWIVLVRAIYAAKGPKGSTGLTAAMKAGPAHLPAFKAAFATVPSDSDAAEWVKTNV